MTNATTGPANTTLTWSAVLGLTAALGSYGLACVFPFAALAALAAVTLPTRQAALLLGAMWLVNQVIGFTLLSYPHDGQAVAWGAIIGVAAFAGLFTAKVAFGSENRLVSVRTIGALVASIVAYQAIMFVGAYAMNGFESSTAAIVAEVARNDLFWFAGLAALRVALGTALPRWFGSAQTLRTA
jgi:thiamine transporter ThiT